MTNTYTIAQRNPMPHGPAYEAVKGLPRNMTLTQAESLANKARFNGLDVVAFNCEAI